jgi:putative phosphoesterase
VRIAVIADTHLPKGARALPAGCVERLRAADLIVHAGDLTGASFLDELAALGPPVAAVHGNVDEPALQRSLPAERVVEADGARIAVVHIGGPAGGRPARLAARFDGCDAVVFGHSHLPEIGRERGVRILNPGSPTERRRAPERTMLELVVERGRLDPQLVRLGT